MGSPQPRPVLRLFLPMLPFLVALTARAGPDDVPTIAVSTARTEAVSTDPGNVATLIFRVENLLPTSQRIAPRIDLPEGWRLVTSLSEFDLSGETSIIRLASIHVPSSASPGSYNLTYLARPVGTADREVRSVAIVDVAPVQKLTASLVMAPRFVVAGRQDSVLAIAVNEGNVDLPVSIEVEGLRGLIATSIVTDTILPARSSVPIHVRLSVDDQITESQTGRLHIRVASSGDTTVAAATSRAIEVITNRHSFSDRRFPAWFTIAGVGNETSGGGQATLAGRGDLGSGDLEFELSAPDRQRTSIFGRRSVYRARYEDRGLRVLLGDNVYSLTPLTEPGRLGIGAGAWARIDKLQVGGFAQSSRYGLLPDEQVAAQTSYMVLPKLDVGAAFMQRRGTYAGDVFALRSVYHPAPTSSLDAECGLSSGRPSDGLACSVEAQGRVSIFSLNALLLRTGSKYPGFNRDLSTRSIGLGVQPSNWMRLQANWLDQRRGLSNGFSRRYRVARIGSILNGRTHDLPATLFVFYQYRELAFDNVSPSWYRQHAVSTRAAYDWQAVGIKAGLELGRTSSQVGGRTFGRSTIEGIYRPSQDHVVSTSLEYSFGAADYLLRSERRWLLNVIGSFKIMDRTTARGIFFASTDRGVIRQSYGAVRLEFDHSFGNGHRMSLRLQHTGLLGHRMGRSSDFGLSYSVPIGLPRQFKKSRRRISGRVYNAETLQGVEGVLMYLGSSRTVTGSDGTFTFGAPTGQALYLRMDRPSAGLGLTSALRMPVIISAESGSIEDLEIPLARSGRVSGSIAPKETERVRDSLDVAAVVVELASGSDRQRTLTGRDGRFLFEDVFPGQWTLSVHHEKLGNAYVMDHKSRTVRVGPDETSDVHFYVRPIRRPHHMIDRKVLTLRKETDEPEGRPQVSGEPVSQDSLAYTNRESRWVESQIVHVVVKDETLSHIAQRYYGRASLWSRIFDANRDSVVNPDLIYPGWHLFIPDGGDVASFSAK